MSEYTGIDSILYIFVVAMYVPTTNTVDMMCQNIQWIVSKCVVVIRGVKIRILVTFRTKKIVSAVKIV